MVLSEHDRQQVQHMLGGMGDPVRLVFFTQSLNCDSCLPARRILEALVPLGEKLSLDERNVILDTSAASQFAVDRVPAIALVAGDRDTGIRFYGAPAGYEFSALVDAILAASAGQSGLSDASRATLAGVTAPVRIKVFVTPT